MGNKIRVSDLIEQHKRLLEKREKAIKNVEYPWNSTDTILEFVKELEDVNEEIDDFLSQEFLKS